MSMVRCWEHFSCGESIRTRCPAYRRGQGRLCWYYAGNFATRKSSCPRRPDAPSSCLDCSFYALVEKEERDARFHLPA